MSVASDTVSFFITQRADRYIDSITITDLTDVGTFNRTSKQYDTSTTNELYAGDALIRPANESTKQRGMQGEVLFDYVIHIPPLVAAGVGPGHTVSVVTSVYDSELAGSTLTVQAVERDSYLTHREVFCNLSQGGGDRG